MPCWARCLLGMWWIWGLGVIVAVLMEIGLVSAGPWGLLAAAAWFGITVVVSLFVCLRRCRNI